jgi:hypothetical protein
MNVLRTASSPLSAAVRASDTPQPPATTTAAATGPVTTEALALLHLVRASKPPLAAQSPELVRQPSSSSAPASTFPTQIRISCREMSCRSTARATTRQYARTSKETAQTNQIKLGPDVARCPISIEDGFERYSRNSLERRADACSLSCRASFTISNATPQQLSNALAYGGSAASFGFLNSWWKTSAPVS